MIDYKKTSIAMSSSGKQKFTLKSLLIKLAAGSFFFFLLKGIMWLVVMAAMALGIISF